MLRSRFSSPNTTNFECICSIVITLHFADRAMEYAVKDGQRHAGLNCVWYPTLTLTKCQWHYRLCQLFYEIIPGAIFDCILPKKPVSCLKISRMIAGTPFLENYTREYAFGASEIDSIWCRWMCQNWILLFTISETILFFLFCLFISSMTETDRHSFNFDTTSIDWKELLSTFLMSVRTYNLKQTPDQLQAAEKLFNYLKLLHFTVKFFVSLLILCTYWAAFGGNSLSLFIVMCFCYYFFWAVIVRSRYSSHLVSIFPLS